MSNSNFDNEIFKNLSKSLGQNPEEIKKSAQQGNMEALMKNLSPSQKQKVSSVLQNPEATKKLLENPQVQALIRKLQNNG